MEKSEIKFASSIGLVKMFGCVKDLEIVIRDMSNEKIELCKEINVMEHALLVVGNEHLNYDIARCLIHKYSKYVDLCENLLEKMNYLCGLLRK